MGQEPTAIRHLAYALERGHFTDPQIVTGEAYHSRRTEFELPDHAPKKLLNFYGHKNHRACAECEHVVEHAFKLGVSNPKYWFTFLPKIARLMLFDRIDLLRGRDAKIPTDHGHLLMVGDCTERLAMEYGVPHVPGCVPRPADVIKRIMEM
jgi:hypothetical protein